MTQGGPNHRTEVLATHLYAEGFDYFKYGYASAISVVLLVLCLVVTFLVKKSLRSKAMRVRGLENEKIKIWKKPLSPVRVVIYIFLLVLAVLYIAPLLWMVSVSLRDNAGVMAEPFGLPEVLHFENYRQAWTLGKLGVALLNSVLVCGVSLLISLFFGAMAAFAIARMRWKLAELTHTFFLVGMMVPVHCILIPLFVRFANLGLTNSRIGLMLPYITFSLPMTIFLLTGFLNPCQ